MFKVYLVPNCLVQVVYMCLLWMFITLCGRPMQVVGPQLVVTRRWTTFHFQNNTTSHQQLKVGNLLTQCTISPPVDVPSPRYGRIYNIFLDDQKYDVTIGISLNVHVFTLSKCWHILWVLTGCMCIVTCVSCILDDHVLWVQGHSSLHMEMGWSLVFVAMFQSFWTLVIVHQNFIHKPFYSWLDYVGSFNTSFGPFIMFSTL